MSYKQKYPFKIRKHEGECPDDEFMFDAIISSKDLDTWNSRMNDQSLDNFVSDINGGGIALVNSHKGDDLNKVLGKWTNAERKGDQVIATASMLRATDNTPPELNVDEHIRRIERGYYNDVSIGFKSEQNICDICDKDIFDWNQSDRCSHYPGQTYNGVKCTYEVRNAHLAEVSLVYDGSNPAAQIINVRNAPKELVNWKEGNVKETNSLLEEFGKRYQKDLIDELIAEKVRVVGHDFDEDKDRKRYLGWNVEDVLEQINTYKKAANITGGRKIESTPDKRRGLPIHFFG